MAYPTVEFLPATPTLGLQPINVTSTTQLHPLGTIARAKDVTYGEGEFIYLVGVASTAAGDLVCYNSKTGATVRAVHGGSTSVGPAGVAMSANVATQYGWYQIAGSGPVASATVSANTSLFLTSTAGTVDDAVVAGDEIDGLTANAASSGGFTACQIDRPNISGFGGSSGTNTGDVTLAAIGSTANANGATLAAQALNLEPASASFGGVVTTGTQTLAGAKTLSSNLTLTTGTVVSGVANTGTNVGFTLNTTNTLSGSTQLLEIKNNGTQKFLLGDTGAVTIQGDLYAGSFYIAGGHLSGVTDSGAASAVGQATLSSGTKTVSTTAVTANSRVFVQLVTPGGTLGANYKVSAIVAGTSFDITSVSVAGATVATDTSVVNWWLIN